MENYTKNTFDINYAAAWSADQGGFSSSLAINLLNYLHDKNIEYKSVLDITCGTGEFLSHFSRSGFACAGTEVAKSMVEYSKAKYPSMQFALTKNIYDLPIKGKFDLVTCNHDMVNTLERFDEWEMLFKNVEKVLSKNGMFMFDYYTKYKLQNWNEVAFEESEEMDHVSNIKKGMENKCIINEIYYIKDLDTNKYTKSFDVQVEAYFENSDILDALHRAGFKNVQLCNFSLEPCEDIETRNRVHVIARR